MNALGTHILLELEACQNKILDDIKQVEAALLESAQRANATIVDSHFNRFLPFGISGVVVIAESHFTIHTWPEYDYAAIDIFTCGNKLQPKIATDYLIAAFQSKKPSLLELKRGLFLGEGKPGNTNILNQESVFQYVRR